eukprot:FR735426.1.p4 GENE.FR735426.1~~FR735426.1.p4  ORF type:complete len:106 (+),score=31.00 FR735426.1:839-1156(+)
MDLTHIYCLWLPCPLFPPGNLAWPPALMNPPNPRGKGGFAYWGVFSLFPLHETPGPRVLRGGGRGFTLPLKGGKNGFFHQNPGEKHPGKKNWETKGPPQKGAQTP